MTSPSFIFSAMKVIAQGIKGAFHSIKPFGNLETEANGIEISKKSFQKFRKLLNFPNANHSKRKFCLEIPGEKMNGKKTSGKKVGYISRRCPRFWKFLKMLLYLLRENAENSRKLTFWLNGKRLKFLYGNYFSDTMSFLVVMN